MSEETINRKDHDRMMSNAILYVRIDTAIADAKFEAEKMGKDKERFVDPLTFAGNLCREILIGIPQQPPQQKTEKKEPEE